MATTAKEGGAGGGRERERKGSSSSNPQIKINKPTTKPSNPSSSSTKPIPNYLKPTISSSLDPSSSASSSSRITRRSSTFNSTSTSTASTTTTNKPASVNRRRSLDKPPSSNNPQNATRGPTNTATLDVKTVSRATPSSTSSKTTFPSTKPAPQRSLSSLSSRSTKPVSDSATSSIRRSLSTKVTPSNSGLNPPRKADKKTASKSVASDSSAELEAHDKDPLDHMIGGGQGHELGMDEEVVSLPEISEMPGQEDQLGDPVMILPKTAEAQNDEVVEQDQETATEKEADNEQLIEDANERNEESVEPADGDDHAEEKGAVEGVMEEDSTKVEEKHVVVVLEGSSASEGSKEGEETKADGDEVAEHQTRGGNKKESQAYNDVIEETASKLMENRKNKVRALAGAFETVISLDSK